MGFIALGNRNKHLNKGIEGPDTGKDSKLLRVDWMWTRCPLQPRATCHVSLLPFKKPNWRTIALIAFWSILVISLEEGLLN